MKLRTITASAPTKVILFGEHFVVYGAPGISIPISPRNWVELRVSHKNPGFKLSGDYGSLIMGPDGRIIGSDALRAFGAPYLYIRRAGFGGGVSFNAKIKQDCSCKGIGNSSSVGAALGLALVRSVGGKFGNDVAFECAQRVDEIAHGGKPSGIDAKTVAEGKPQRFSRVFSPPSFQFNRINITLADEFQLIVIDTFKGMKSKTSELIEKFRLRVGAGGEPDAISNKERKRICAPYMAIYEQAVKLVVRGNPRDARVLASLMNKNHELLRDCGVSTPSIEYVRDTCLDAGALGVKITGAGGEGGAVLALFEKRQQKDIEDSIKKLGYKSFIVRLADRGAVIER